MNAVVLVLFCVTSSVAGLFLPESDDCIALPCAPPLCPSSELITTYYEYKGKNCTGCEVCRTEQDIPLQKRLALSAPLCPVVDCFFPPPDCPVDLVVGTIQIGDIKCPGCSQCPVAVDE